MNTTLGDFGAGGRRSPAGDQLLNTKERAIDAATGEWQYQAHTSNTVGWHIPETPKTLLLKQKPSGWQLVRANKPIGSRDTLAEALDLAEQYMADRPEGRRR
ncbi:hypothetical protein ACFR9U_14315 [Halorientalis brevis]|uniref:Uncharacterized protein n=1 Tax=Halorientalis brevis TaxID=1126241 RepID=A0ABD6CFP3_9EURY|nr:hypothetical protein [Halorientalis brevis]